MCVLLGNMSIYKISVHVQYFHSHHEVAVDNVEEEGEVERGGEGGGLDTGGTSEPETRHSKTWSVLSDTKTQLNAHSSKNV